MHKMHIRSIHKFVNKSLNKTLSLFLQADYFTFLLLTPSSISYFVTCSPEQQGRHLFHIWRIAYAHEHRPLAGPMHNRDRRSVQELKFAKPKEGCLICVHCYVLHIDHFGWSLYLVLIPVPQNLRN